MIVVALLQSLQDHTVLFRAAAGWQQDGCERLLFNQRAQAQAAVESLSKNL